MIYDGKNSAGHGHTIEVVCSSRDVVRGYDVNFDLEAFEVRLYGNAARPSWAATAMGVEAVLVELERQRGL